MFDVFTIVCCIWTGACRNNRKQSFLSPTKYISSQRYKLINVSRVLYTNVTTSHGAFEVRALAFFFCFFLSYTHVFMQRHGSVDRTVLIPWWQTARTLPVHAISIKQLNIATINMFLDIMIICNTVKIGYICRNQSELRAWPKIPQGWHWLGWNVVEDQMFSQVRLHGRDRCDSYDSGS